MVTVRGVKIRCAFPKNADLQVGPDFWHPTPMNRAISAAIVVDHRHGRNGLSRQGSRELSWSTAEPDDLGKRFGTVRTPAEHDYASVGSSLSFGVRGLGLSLRPGGTGGDWLPSLAVTRNEGVRGSNPRVGLACLAGVSLHWQRPDAASGTGTGTFSDLFTGDRYGVLVPLPAQGRAAKAVVLNRAAYSLGAAMMHIVDDLQQAVSPI